MKSRLSSAHAAGGAFAIFGLPDANEQLITVIPCSLGSSSLVGAGNLPAGSKVCMVEDTTTTGGSLVKAIERATAAGLEVVQVLTIVDREEGAEQTLADAGYTLEALVTRTQLLADDA